jgi:hypothetical protein
MRAVVNVATGAHYMKGQQRLVEWLALNGEPYRIWNDGTGIPHGSPTHLHRNYAFKGYALEAAAREGGTSLLWCDASIIPVRDLMPLWKRIEEEGYWISRTGWSNYQWTSDGSYPHLFPEVFEAESTPWEALNKARALNRMIPHVASTAFGVSLLHPVGRRIFDEFVRLSKTPAFHGAWRNLNSTAYPVQGEKRAEYNAPPDVLGHRHDQTALSVIAWREGCKLTDCPDVFAYKGGETEDTILIADGEY